MSRIGDKIRNARQVKKMNQKQLAKKLGVSEKFINEVEIGKRIANQDIIDRLSKILGKEINDITMSFEENVYKEEKKSEIKPVNSKKIVNDVWSDALSDVLKNIPIYNYDLNKSIGFKQLPVIHNKVEGYSKDKVLYLKISDDDMSGFRIKNGDMAFGHLTQEIENNAILLLEYDGNRVVRQIKRLGGSKVLLISNSGSLRTETKEEKELKPILKLDRLEINL